MSETNVWKTFHITLALHFTLHLGDVWNDIWCRKHIYVENEARRVCNNVHRPDPPINYTTNKLEKIDRREDCSVHWMRENGLTTTRDQPLDRNSRLIVQMDEDGSEGNSEMKRKGTESNEAEKQEKRGEERGPWRKQQNNEHGGKQHKNKAERDCVRNKIEACSWIPYFSALYLSEKKEREESSEKRRRTTARREWWVKSEAEGESGRKRETERKKDGRMNDKEKQSGKKGGRARGEQKAAKKNLQGKHRDNRWTDRERGEKRIEEERRADKEMERKWRNIGRKEERTGRDKPRKGKSGSQIIVQFNEVFGNGSCWNVILFWISAIT